MWSLSGSLFELCFIVCLKLFYLGAKNERNFQQVNVPVSVMLLRLLNNVIKNIGAQAAQGVFKQKPSPKRALFKIRQTANYKKITKNKRYIFMYACIGKA